MKYPRYTRSQNLACKLTESQIKKIQRDKKSPRQKLAEKYNVSVSAICYWQMTNQKRLELHKKSWQIYGDCVNRQYKREKDLRHRRRKTILMGAKYKKYQKYLESLRKRKL